DRGRAGRRAEVQPQRAPAAGEGAVRGPAAAGGPAYEDWLLDRRRHPRISAREAPDRRPDPRPPPAVEAQVDLRRRTAAAGRPDERAGPHLVWAGQHGHRTALVVEPEPHEH